jgi:GAF domain-containing protein
MRRSLESPPGDGGYDIRAGADRRLERLTAELTQVRSLAELGSVTTAIATELHADEVAFSVWNRERDEVETFSERGWGPTGEIFALADFPLTRRVLTDQVAAQVLVTDPDADRAEVEQLKVEGHRALLMVPIVSAGETFALLEVYADQERPWSATAINRARIICAQFGGVLTGLGYAAPFAGPSARNSSSSELKRAGRSIIGR